ncbi:hypothetical protein DPSP01_004187 [Paraphaeosphaeria sporulosa]|uniref:Uncharacterized protein n=1 Tax=Paraphaeosphaeria sporulosa TaxID=1460663 RepID=A0A177CBB0_9PLEO|nr:uncharacterized protein CC84DRAFT_1218043 [Paraphaeosphaeria sporulosa]OAG04606.1 hypothetical protein CC84DRAFT_1218043 [Paraphaeosphaeria sporulosa]
MVNFTRLTCLLAIASLTSSQSLSSSAGSSKPSSATSRRSGIVKGSNRPVTSGVAAPTGGQTNSTSAPPDSLLPPLSLLDSKLRIRQIQHPQVETRVGPPLSGPVPGGTAAPLPSSDAPSATRRFTGISRRQQASSNASQGSSLPAKPSNPRPSGPPSSGVPSADPDVQEQKFSKLPPNFDSIARATPRATKAIAQFV